MEKVKIRQATKKGYIECEVGGVADFSYPTSELRSGRVQGGGNVCPTITAQSMGICRIEKVSRGGGYCDMQENYNLDNNPVVWGGLQEHQCPRSDGISPALTAAMGMGGGQTPIFTEREDKNMAKVGQISCNGSQCGSVFSDDGSMATLTAGTHGYANPHICSKYRIRKLTPLECWRLMGFSDEDFHKAELENSNTQLYKQAGNSIVENVLVAIFGQMLSGKENVYRELGNKNYNKETE